MDSYYSNYRNKYNSDRGLQKGYGCVFKETDFITDSIRVPFSYNLALVRLTSGSGGGGGCGASPAAGGGGGGGEGCLVLLPINHSQAYNYSLGSAGAGGSGASGGSNGGNSTVYIDVGAKEIELIGGEGGGVGEGGYGIGGAGGTGGTISIGNDQYFQVDGGSGATASSPYSGGGGGSASEWLGGDNALADGSAAAGGTSLILTAAYNGGRGKTGKTDGETGGLVSGAFGSGGGSGGSITDEGALSSYNGGSGMAGDMVNTYITSYLGFF